MRETLHPFDLPGSMTPTDALFWYTERAVPAFRPIIAALCILDRPPRKDGIAASIETMIRLVPRLRQRVAEAPFRIGLPHYVDDPHFDSAYHFRHLCAPKPGRMRDLLDLSSSLLATPLDRERPLWEAYWIDGLEPGGRSAFFLKLHHSLVDGVGSLSISDALMQRARHQQSPRIGNRECPDPEASSTIRGSIGKFAVDCASTYASAVSWAASLPAELLADPNSAWRSAASLIGSLRGATSDAAHARVVDPLAKGASGISRRLDVLDVSLARLRAIKCSLGGTINDVILSALAHAVGAYHREHGVHIPELNCLVPVSLRTNDEKQTFGNRIGVINITLPIGEQRIERCLAHIIAQTSMAKSDHRGTWYPTLLRGLMMLPDVAISYLAHRSFGRVNLVCTNIPGMEESRYMAGAKVSAIYPFASPVEGTPLTVALVSYSGRMDIGIGTDPEAIPDPHRLSVLFANALDEFECSISVGSSEDIRPKVANGPLGPLHRPLPHQTSH